MREHRVVITGLGMVTPLGIGTEAFWSALRAGAVAVRSLTRFDASDFASRMAAQIDDFDPHAFMQRRRVQWTDRFSQFAVAAARLAIEDAAFDARGFEDDVGIFTGSALGGLALAEEQIAAFHERGLRAVRPLLTISVFGGAATSNIAIDFDLRGPNVANANSCASGLVAIGEAYRAIKRGDARAAVAGGIEAPLAPLTYGAFVVARAMSTRNEDPAHASRPFDRDRDGFVMAEGAGVVVLERYADAVKRDARVYCEVAGFGLTNDAHHMSAPRPDAAQTARAMSDALKEAHISPEDVDAVNAHGSSTRIGDAAEAQAYGHVFGERASRVPVTATKGQHGHALGATGAWEIGLSALAMRDGVLPGAVNLEHLDDACTIACARDTQAMRPKVVLSNSSGFGGINAAMVLTSPERNESPLSK